MFLCCCCVVLFGICFYCLAQYQHDVFVEKQRWIACHSDPFFLLFMFVLVGFGRLFLLLGLLLLLFEGGLHFSFITFFLFTSVVDPGVDTVSIV